MLSIVLRKIRLNLFLDESINGCLQNLRILLVLFIKLKVLEPTALNIHQGNFASYSRCLSSVCDHNFLPIAVSFFGQTGELKVANFFKNFILFSNVQ